MFILILLLQFYFPHWSRKIPEDPESNFENLQKRFPRVRTAFNLHEASIKGELVKRKIDEKKLSMAILAYKEESCLEIWLGEEDSELQLVEEMEICASSGKPGPKTKEGDFQVPEGFYNLNCFNPGSRYHLSMCVNYPNESDLRRNPGVRRHGGAIMVHGGCITIGCIPVTNQSIERLYVYAVKARSSGQDAIPIYIFPARPDGARYKTLLQEYPWHKGFWTNLSNGHTRFIQRKKMLDIQVSPTGEYRF
jgi:murein L,D-transpeptidase YafK